MCPLIILFVGSSDFPAPIIAKTNFIELRPECCDILIGGNGIDTFIVGSEGTNIIYDLGVALGFVGLIMYMTGRALAKAPLLARNHPFVKESLIHHT